MVNEKVLCYLKAVEFYQNCSLDTQQSVSFDLQSALSRHGESLTNFFIKSCFDRLEAVKLAALKGLEFLFENASGVLERQLPLLLKCFMLIYPYHDESEPQDLLPIAHPIKLKSQLTDEQTIKVRLDLIHLLLENFIYIMPNVNAER